EAAARRPAWRNALLRTYYAGIRAATGTSMSRIRRNLTVVNSAWTGALVRRVHGSGIETVVVHPPAALAVEEPLWSARRSAFVAVGRMAPDKRFELLIEIIGRVRALGHEVALDIVAGASEDRRYEAKIGELVAARPWVRLHRGVARAELAALLA